MTQVAHELGLPRETLFDMIAGEGPCTESVARVLRALGRQRATEPAAAPAH